MMNYFCPEMNGYVSPTDSRFREDLRHYEEGKVEESEIAKLIIEDEQRRKRKAQEEGTLPPYKGKFFKKEPHPFVT